MSSRPRVTVVTPTYNHERYIGTCIESVLNQTFEDWEMVVVDDGSTDGTRAVVEAYADSRIKLVRQENVGIAGLSRTYNRALAESQGEFVAILEGDDYWPPYKLQVQLPYFGEGVVLVTGLTMIVDTDGAFRGVMPMRSLPPEASNNSPIGVAAKVMMDPEVLTYTFPVSTMVRRDALERIGGFQQPEYSPVLDFPTFLRLTLEGEFRFATHICGVWRRHISSTTLSRFPEILEAAYRASFDFLHAHRDRLPLGDEELDALELRWDHYMAQLCTLRGRMLAADGKRTEAVKAFREASLYRRTRHVNLALKLSSATASAGMSAEWLFRLFGRPDWRALAYLPTGDALVSPKDLERPRPVLRWRL
jgi:glycosyltransferase involved in cell wall biosynthesis